MPERFFAPPDAVADGTVVIEGPLARHMARSLRLRPGERVVLVADDREHGVVLRAVGERVEGQVTWTRPATGEPGLRITVIQALPRDRMEDCIDVLVEAGAAAIMPVLTERVVARPSADRAAPRALRWQTVAAEAAQLAGRGVVPLVHAPTTLAEALARLPHSRVLACTFDGPRPIAEVDADAGVPLALCIGPEGGFGDRDIETLRAAGAELVHLGARILRTRYAGAVACALLFSRSGDLSDPITPPPG